jgi:hypothetical protein
MVGDNRPSGNHPAIRRDAPDFISLHPGYELREKGNQCLFY